MLKKVVVCLCAILMILFSTGVPSYAQRALSSTPQLASTVQPRWINVSGITLVLDVSKSPIYVSFSIGGYLGTTFSNGTLVLEKISGSHTGVIKTWTGLSCSSPAYIFDDDVYTTLTAGQYRMTLTITATNNGASEVIEVSKVSVR